MILLSKPFPLLTVVAFAVLSALPWGGDETFRSVLPMTPLAAIHFWSVRRPHLMPAVGVFLLGLLLDLLSQGPIGFYTLLALIVGLISSQMAGLPSFRTRLGRALLALLVLSCAEGFAWGLASLYVYAMQPIKPYVTAFLILSIGYPLMAVIFNFVDSLLLSRPQSSIFSGRG